MAQEVVVLAVHGMGETKDDFADDFEEKLAGRMGSDWSRVYFRSVYYQDILQDNQKVVFDKLKAKNDLDAIKLRRFLLYGFSDAAGLERRASAVNSPYERAQKRILDQLDLAYGFLGGAKPVVVVAQSLGCQVVSNYLWDAQRPGAANQGVWRVESPGGVPRGSDQDRFRRLKQMKFLYTTGCNIPIFVAGFPQSAIKAVATRTKGYAFTWKNFYDEDDALGWPIKHLSPSYRDAVYRDFEINAGSILTSWNPLSHVGYWTDADLLKPLERDIRKLLP